MRNTLSVAQFKTQFARFQHLIQIYDKGNPFVSFQEGIAGAWENYKPRLREHALGVLAPNSWVESAIGSGTILQRTIKAIEIQDGRLNLTNNLVFWQNRFGHANRDHRVLLEAASNSKLRQDLETLLFGLYRKTANEISVFNRLSELTGSKYPLLAYLYFLKDMDRFMPIQPTTFDRAFRSLGIGLTTLRNCSWENYQAFNAALEELQEALVSIAGLSKVRLVDAHSFCWLLERMEQELGRATESSRGSAGRIFGARERSIYIMRTSVENTVTYSNGQIVERVVKNKELRMTSEQFEKLLASLLDLQENRCALTGIPFHFDGPEADKNLLPSVDRIDSDGHYEAGNLQIVCQFVNFWKGNTNNEEFKRLLLLIRGLEA
jgi:hypothetical protein